MEVLELPKRTIEQESLIVDLKSFFEEQLKKELNLKKVNAPLFVEADSGLNDNLNGIEEPVSFEVEGKKYEIVHSLAKWKRWYLGELDVQAGNGIVTDMKAIRVDEKLSPIHSRLVDQWDWEKVIGKEERTMTTLIDHAMAVYEALKATDVFISQKESRSSGLPSTPTIIHTENLMLEFPELSPKNREHAIAKKHGAVILIGIGGKLSNGEVHDLRAPDYDDWSTKDRFGRPGLNADIIIWDSVRGRSMEISSMGIRVDENVLKQQLKELNCEDRLELSFHKSLISGKLPFTIGGGIGQSRVAMVLTKKKDITSVQPVTR